MSKKIKESHLYNIIREDKTDLFLQFLGENPGYDLHHALSSGKRYRLLCEAIHSNSLQIVYLLMNIMVFDELYNIYHYFIFHSSNTMVFRRFIEKCEENIEREDIFQNLVFHLLSTHKNHEEDARKFWDKYNTRISKFLKDDPSIRYNFENRLLYKSFSWALLLNDIYKKNEMNTDELYSKFILRDSNFFKKMLKHMKIEDWNHKVYIMGDNYAYDQLSTEIKKSEHTYSFAFLCLLKGNVIKKKNIDLWKDDYLEKELLQFLDEKKILTFICSGYYYLRGHQFDRMKSMYEKKQYMCHIFYQEIDGDIKKRDLFNMIKPYFTENIKKRLHEINENVLQMSLNVYDNEISQKYCDVTKVTGDIQSIYESNKSFIDL